MRLEAAAPDDRPLTGRRIRYGASYCGPSASAASAATRPAGRSYRCLAACGVPSPSPKAISCQVVPRLRAISPRTSGTRLNAAVMSAWSTPGSP